MVLYRVNKLIREILINSILKLKKFKSNESIIIFSEARGGSTWLMEMLNDILDVSINWEPLYVDGGVVPKEFRFGWRPYIPKEDTSSGYFTLFKNIQEFRIHTGWTTSRLKISKLFKSKQVLVKYVRANMLIPYLLKNFNYKHAPILLLRHPVDSCLSHMKAFKKSVNNSVGLEVPNCINNDRYLKDQEYINGLESEFEVGIAKWCLDNCNTLNQLEHLNNVHVIYYSDLLRAPKQVIAEYLKQNGLRQYLERLNKVNFRQVSSTDFVGEYRDDMDEQLFKNFNKLDEATKTKIQDIFDYFEFKLFTAFSPYPNTLNDTILSVK